MKPQRNLIIQKRASLSKLFYVITCGPWSGTLWMYHPEVTSLIYKPQDHCVSYHFSGSPVGPQSASRAINASCSEENGYGVFVEGKAFLVMTLLSPGLSAHDL